MAATITGSPYTSAPGLTVTLTGTDLNAGAGASVVLQNQGPAGTSTTAIANPTFAGTSVSFVVPDGCVSGQVLVTSSDSTQATAQLTVNSQYLLTPEYFGEGVDLTDLQPGELDRILQRASAYADAYIAQGNRETMTMRKLQTTETAKWRKSRRIYPRRWPIISIDQAVYIASNTLQVNLATDTFVLEPDYGYAELVIWSFGWTYIAQIASTTLADAGIMQYTYTAGYPTGQVPQALREAVSMITTELLTYRSLQAKGLGGFSAVKQGNEEYQRRTESFDIPQPAKDLLKSLRILRPS